MKSSFVVIDLETTGLSPENNHIIEVGAIKVREGKIVDTYSTLIDPGYALPETIVEITNITDQMLEGARQWNEVCEELLAFLGEDCLLGHNIGFDYRFLKMHFYRAGYSFERPVIDTLEIARLLHPELPSRSLGSLCNAYALHNKSAHRALEDASVTMQLYFAMCEVAKQKGLDMSSKEWNATPYHYSVKKQQPITPRQKNYLLDLVKYHKIDKVQNVETLTKSQASRLIDQIIFEYGKMQ